MSISTPEVLNFEDKNMKFDICKNVSAVVCCREIIATKTFQTSVRESIRIMEGTLEWVKYETAPPSSGIFLFFVVIPYFPHQDPGEGVMLWEWPEPGVWQLLRLWVQPQHSSENIPPGPVPRSPSTNGRRAVCEDQVWRFVDLCVVIQW